LLLPGTGQILMGLAAAVICYAFLSLTYLNVPRARHDRARNEAATSGRH
jgi:hypothetical protein